MPGTGSNRLTIQVRGDVPRVARRGAFACFKGCPRTLLRDNLKSVILINQFYLIHLIDLM
jgi:hypothetical protein